MTISFRRPSTVTNNFGLSGYPQASDLAAGDQVFNVHPAAHTYNGHALYTLLFVVNTHTSARTYSTITISPTIVGTAKSTVTVGLATAPKSRLMTGTAATYSRTSGQTTATITLNSHGLASGDIVYLDFASGSADGSFTVGPNPTINTFTVTTVETTAQTNIVVTIYSPYVTTTAGIATPYNAPTGVTFGSSVTISDLYSGGSSGPRDAKAIWLKRTPIAYTSLTATNGINADGDVRLNITGSYT